MRKLLLILLIVFRCSVGWCGVDFDGSNDGLSVADDDTLDGYSSISVGSWVKRNGAQPDSGFGTMIVRDATSGQPSYAIFIKDTGCRFRLNTSTDNNALNSWEINDNFTSGAWHHIVWTWTSGETPKAYFDGVLQALDLDNGAVSGTMTNATTALLIGEVAADGLSYKGQLTELFVYDVVLTANQISLLANSDVKRMPLQIQPADLQIYLPLDDEPDGSSADTDTFNDMSQNTNNATGNGGASLTAKAEEVLSYP